MLALVLLVQEKTGEQTLWSFPGRCQGENGAFGMLGRLEYLPQIQRNAELTGNATGL